MQKWVKSPAKEGRIHEHKAVHSRGPPKGKRKPDASTHRYPNDVRLFDTVQVQEADYNADKEINRIATGGFVRATGARKLERPKTKVLSQLLECTCPILQATPELGLAMLGSISLWTRKILSKLELHTQRRVEERLAIYLLSRSGPVELEPGDRIELAEPRNLIAAQCGTAPEVLSRTFRRLEDDGILKAEPRHVIIHDPDSLRSLAELIE